MGDVFKSMFDAWNERLRSPFWGAIILAFLAFNWQPIWYLLFAEVSVEAKFEYWEEHAQYWRAIFAGIFFAMVAPLIKVCVMAWNKVPTRAMRGFKDSEATKRKINKIELDTQLQNARDRMVLDRERSKAEARKIGGEEAVDKITEDDRRYGLDEFSTSIISEILSNETSETASRRIRQFDLHHSEELFALQLQKNSEITQHEFNKIIDTTLKSLSQRGYLFINFVDSYWDEEQDDMVEIHELLLSTKGRAAVSSQ